VTECTVHAESLPCFNIMDSFDNFQYDSASSYGGLGVADDTSSVYNTQDGVDLSSLSLSEYNGSSSVDHELNHHQHPQARNGLDEDFDAVLDDLKDEGVLDLPPHACRCVMPLFKKIKINNFFL
jgi:regulator of nonsense transcripts 1